MFKYAPKQSKQHHELLQQFTYRPFLLAEESLAMYFDMPLLNLLLIVNWTATRPSHYRPSFLFRREQKNTKWVSDSKEELHLTNFSVLTKFFADLKKKSEIEYLPKFRIDFVFFGFSSKKCFWTQKWRRLLSDDTMLRFCETFLFQHS